MGAAPAPRTLLLGASGFLGSNVAGQLVRRGERGLVLHVGRRSPTSGPHPYERMSVHADLADGQAVSALLGSVRPRRIINCVALADVDRCEAEPTLADALNRRLPALLATWAREHGADLLHVSTDAVFDGSGGPYGVQDRPAPLNAYGRTKRAGEEEVLAEHPDALVARTNIVGWSPSGTRSLLEFFHGRLAAGVEVPGFTDVSFRPLPVQRFLPGCEALLDAGQRGIVHLTGPELLSKYAFGVMVARGFGFDDALVVPARVQTAGLTAARAPTLDVLPTLLPDGSMPVMGSLADGLAELRSMRPSGSSPAPEVG